MKKALTFVLLLVVLCIPAMATDFYDLPRDDSEKSQAVYKLADAGIVGGYENGTFRPNNQLTRAELCKIVNLIFEFTTPATSNFADVKDTDWFYGHVLVAKQAGYINGFENNTFRGNANLTREQTCAIISRITKLELKSSNIVISDKVSDWAKNDVLKVISNGIIPLEENGIFRATENITRAELCMALASYVNTKNEESENAKNLYTAEELNEQAKKYVGEITCFDKNGNELSIGTGFVYTEDGKVITNYHVIDGAYSAKIIINGVEYDIKSVLGYDEHIDIAILKINGNNFHCVTIAENESITGNTVYAIGSSRGFTNTFSKGIITYSNRVIDNVSYIQHDASITNGNSGGPLINEYGEVIGINTWGISDSQNLNFAISISELNKIKLDKSLSLEQLYNSKFTVYDILSAWVQENYNSYGDGYVCYDIKKSESEVFSLTYYYKDQNLAIDYNINFNNGDGRFVSIELFDVDLAFYYAYYRAKTGEENTTSGYFSKPKFTAETRLTHSSSEGGNWSIESLLDTYQEGVIYVIGFFDEFLERYFPDLSLKDFGFNSFVPVKWEPYKNNLSAYQEEYDALIEWANEQVEKIEQIAEEIYYETIESEKKRYFPYYDGNVDSYAEANAKRQLEALMPTILQTAEIASKQYEVECLERLAIIVQEEIENLKIKYNIK